MVRSASPAAPRAARLATAASAVRKTALTLPSAAPGIARCSAVCPITSAIEPDMPTAAAAGSALASDDEVNSR